MTNICEMAFQTMPKEDIAHWQSDLYLRVTPQSTALVNDFDFKHFVTTFIDQIDHVLWYDIPFGWTGSRE